MKIHQLPHADGKLSILSPIALSLLSQAAIPEQDDFPIFPMFLLHALGLLHENSFILPSLFPHAEIELQ